MKTGRSSACFLFRELLCEGWMQQRSLAGRTRVVKSRGKGKRGLRVMLTALMGRHDDPDAASANRSRKRERLARPARASREGQQVGLACWVGPCEIRTAAPLAKEAIAMQQPTGHSARGLCLRGACLITRWRGQMAWTALDGRDGTLDCAGWTRRNMDCALGRAARRASRLLGTGGEEEEEGEQPGFASTPCTWAAPALVAAGSWTLARGSWLPQAELAR